MCVRMFLCACVRVCTHVFECVQYVHVIISVYSFYSSSLACCLLCLIHAHLPCKTQNSQYYVTALCSISQGTIVSPGTPNYRQPDCRNDSATPTRWDSRDNLIDSLPDDIDPQLFLVKHDFTAQGDGQLTVHRGEKVKVTDFSGEGDWVEGRNSQGDVGWLPASYIVQCDSLEKYSWYHGNITRAAAEVALSSGINGSFLIRESESKPGQYSISLRYSGRMYHYRISQDAVTKKYFVMQDIKFGTLKELVHYHSQQADGLVCTLHYPAPNPKKPTIFGLSQADEWEINRSNIEMGQKLGGGQYGEVYKGIYLKTGQAVAVKTFRVSQ